MKVWSIETGRELTTFAGYLPGKGAGGGSGQGVRHVATSPDCRLVASVCGSVTKLWSIADGREVHTLGTDGPMPSLHVPFSGPPSSALFSPDGKTVACASGATQAVTLFAVDGGRQQHAWYLPYRFALLGFSPDGRTLLTHSANGSAYALTLPPDQD